MTIPPMLAADHVHFRYRGVDEELFGGFSHSFAAGSVTALTGPSGRGKSTLLYILGLMLRPSSGAVQVAGAVASTQSDAARARVRAQRIGFVFQDAELDANRTLLDSVIEPGLYAGGCVSSLRTTALGLLDRFGLSHRALHRPGQISGGQAQRVAVCRALVNTPDIVLADEPTGNLDPDNALRVVQALRDAAAEGRTVVIATHDPVVVAQADAVIRL